MVPMTKKELKKGTTPSTLLSAFISTHRLSKRKTTRSPPLLIHRVKISLGKHSSTEMPIQITWSAEHAFISSSSESNDLSLFRVELFAPPKGEKKDLVCVPRESILLPKSARSVGVRYFPPRPQDARALVAIGGSADNKGDEAKADNKAGKDEKAASNEKSEDSKSNDDKSRDENAKDENAVKNERAKDDKAGDNTPNDKKSESDPAKALIATDEIPKDEETPAKEASAKEAKKDTSKTTPKTHSPPLLIYLNIETDLGGWVLSDAIEELKPGTVRGSLEQKMDKFMEDDCCG